MSAEKVLLFTLMASVTAVVYNYFLYPALIVVLSKIRGDKHRSMLTTEYELPTVSFVIAAYNEEKVIEAKILNTLEIDYPVNKMQVIVVSDGSSDKTASIVNLYAGQVTALHEEKRGGKSAALNRAMSVANGEIIVFSDANNDFSNDSVKQLVKHFVDPMVGAVTGAKHIYESRDRQASIGDGLYWKYESKIKKAESSLGSITAAEGEILAVRSRLLKPIDPKVVNDDAAITFEVVKAGYRVLYEERAVSLEEASKELKDDINVKIRMTFGGYQTIANELWYLLPPRTWFALSFLSHKVLRWLTPHFMLITLLTSCMLIDNPIILGFLIVQIVFYSISAYGWVRRKSLSLPKWIYIPMYFTSMNAALFIGFIRFLKDPTKVSWKKAAR